MSEDDLTSRESNASLSKSWEAENAQHLSLPLFLPDELDIFTNKMTSEAFIFHAKTIDYSALDHIEYSQKDYQFIVHLKDGRTQDLGVKAQWLIRPYIKRAKEISVVKTKDKVSVDGVILPLVHTNLDT